MYNKFAGYFCSKRGYTRVFYFVVTHLPCFFDVLIHWGWAIKKRFPVARKEGRTKDTILDKIWRYKNREKNYKTDCYSVRYKVYAFIAKTLCCIERFSVFIHVDFLSVITTRMTKQQDSKVCCFILFFRDSSRFIIAWFVLSLGLMSRATADMKLWGIMNASDREIECWRGVCFFAKDKKTKYTWKMFILVIVSGIWNISTDR